MMQMRAFHGPRPPPGTEDAARLALLAGLRRLRREAGLVPLPGGAACRWRRSGADGLLVAGPDDRTLDAIVWLPLVPLVPLVPPVSPMVPETGTTAAPAPAEPAAPVAWLRRLLRQRPAVQAVLILEAPFATPLACTEPIRRDGIPAIVDDVWRLGGGTVPCAAGEATLASILAGRDTCLLASTGLVAQGDAIDTAAAAARRVERIARTWWHARLLGDPIVLRDDCRDAADFDTPPGER